MNKNDNSWYLSVELSARGKILFIGHLYPDRDYL